MMNNIEYIRDLIVKHLRQEPLTEEQSDGLEEWIEGDEENHQLFSALNDDEKMVAALARYIQVSELTSAANKQAQEIIFPKATVLAMKNPGRWYKYVAAAVIVLVGTGVVYYVSNKPGKQPIAETVTTQKAIKQDVAPGGNKAELTLGDNTKIVLNEAVNGSLAQQGNAAISKQEGVLTYHKDQSTNSKEIIYNTVSTPRGGQYQLVLSDGTRLWFNAASRVKFPAAFLGKERIIEVSGQVYLEVASSYGERSRTRTGKKMPFTVKVNDIEIEVLGTHFDINSYANEEVVKTTLLEGAIRLRRGNNMVVLAPGQQAQSNVREAGQPIRVVSHVDVQEAVAWKDGMFYFKKTDFKAVMRQLEMWYDIEVAYEGPPEQNTFTGELQRSMPLSTVLRHLEKAQIHFRMEGRKLTVLP